MSEYKELLPVVKPILERHMVRFFDERVSKGKIGDTALHFRCHLNDLNSCNTTKLAEDIELATGADVSYIGVNMMSVTIPESKIPGTVAYRFEYLMGELEKRFMKGAEHRKLCGEPPEDHLLREIDAYMNQRLLTKTCPRCYVEMKHGIAIDPKHDDNAIYMTPRRPLPFEDVDLIIVWKCPKCGLSDDNN